MNSSLVAFAKPDILDDYVKRGLLIKRSHNGLHIYNYSQKCVYEKAWDEVTLHCRGLIVDDTNEVIARPFPKFFNIEEWGDKPLPEGPVEVYDKLDGSLFIATNHRKHGLVTASRGSFTSDQACHGRFLLEHTHLIGGFTYIFEVIYPENKIVVDYGSADKLVLLGIIDTTTGRNVPHDDVAYEAKALNIECVEKLHELPSADSAHKLKELIGKNQEGFVLRFADNTRIKIKGTEYLRLHKLLTNTNNKTVWEALRSGKNIEDIVQDVPDEFMRWVQNTVSTFYFRYNNILNANIAAYQTLRDLPRPQFAQGVRSAVRMNDLLDEGILFGMKDGKPVSDRIWKILKPTDTVWPKDVVGEEE